MQMMAFLKPWLQGVTNPSCR